MICCAGCRSLLALYFRSPMARERLRFPFTRHTPPMSLRKPPAASIRFFSRSCAGLWSLDSATAVPPRHSTALLSPALATYTFPSLSIATTAVQPAWILCSGSSQSSSASASMSATSSTTAVASSMAAGAELPAPEAPPFSLFIILFSMSIFRSTSSASFFSPVPSSPPPSVSASALLLDFKLWICAIYFPSRSISSIRWNTFSSALSFSPL
mmetsp:Transcript_21569/g.38473  ORF Transcript_21569/g.38473 Transcript_21569/m.38473 type:complete len:212 (-) Transcript_21569:658-1293(-)